MFQKLLVVGSLALVPFFASTSAMQAQEGPSLRKQSLSRHPEAPPGYSGQKAEGERLLAEAQKLKRWSYGLDLSAAAIERERNDIESLQRKTKGKASTYLKNRIAVFNSRVARYNQESRKYNQELADVRHRYKDYLQRLEQADRRRNSNDTPGGSRIIFVDPKTGKGSGVGESSESKGSKKPDFDEMPKGSNDKSRQSPKGLFDDSKKNRK